MVNIVVGFQVLRDFDVRLGKRDVKFRCGGRGVVVVWSWLGELIRCWREVLGEGLILVRRGVVILRVNSRGRFGEPNPPFLVLLIL